MKGKVSQNVRVTGHIEEDLSAIMFQFLDIVQPSTAITEVEVVNP
jgi:hypothetical protein